MYTVIDDAAPRELAALALAEMRVMDYNFNECRAQYQGEQLFDSPVLPQAREIYTASFYRAHPTQTMADAAEKALMAFVRPHLGPGTFGCEMWAQRMMVRDHYRTHHDGYLAPVSFVWYLNDNWRCDWGGLFMHVDEADELHAVVPRFNRLLILSGSRVPHFVTAIEPAALQPRYAVVGFMRETNVSS